MKIFIVEKDKQFHELIGRCLLENTNNEVKGFDDEDIMLTKLNERPNVIILNNALIRDKTDFIISQISKSQPPINVLLICNPDEVNTCTPLLGKGIYDYISTGKGFIDRLLSNIQKLNVLEGLQSEIFNLKSHINRKYEVSNAIIGESKAIKKVLTLVEKAISVPSFIVSVHGESGTGKELIARTIHFNSNKKESPFITVNMGAMPREMIESELFGHEKGSKPGAYSRFIGAFEQASHGSIFINEIAELDLNLQFKLLKTIKEKTIKRTGSRNAEPIDCRIIIATSKDLLEEVRLGNFREDLYYSLLGIPIFLPPLTRRENDIMILAEYFLKTFCQENSLPEKTCNPQARSKLLTYNYPGNVRELNAIVELAAVLSNNQLIEEEHIMLTPTPSEPDIFQKEITLREFEIKIIRHYLEKYNNNVVLVAKKLEIGKSKIYNMIKQGEL